MRTEPLSRWVVSTGDDRSVRVRVFCIPHAGGGASLFRHWSAHARDDIGVCAVQLPGRENRLRDPPLHHLTTLVSRLAIELRPYLDRPFALFGHSMGAVIAYELARTLRSDDPAPVHLFVSGHRAPHLPARRQPLHTLPPGAFEAALAGLGGTPTTVLQDAELMALFAPTLRADLAAIETYVYEPGEPLDIPLTAFGGESDPEADRHDLEAWRLHTRHFSGVRVFPGHHFYLRDDPAPVVRAIRNLLAEIPSAQG